MTRRRQLESAVQCRWAACLAGILGAAAFAFAVPQAPQTNTTREEAKPQKPAHGSSSAPKHEFPTGGVWHHFGEKGNASAAPGSQAGGAYPSGANRNVLKASPGGTSQSAAAGRTGVLERQMWALVNQDRLRPEALAETGGQAHPLKWNERLAAVARAHSLNMLKQHSFSHTDRDGTTFSVRIKRAGIPWQASGENIAIYDTVERAEFAFMNEPRFQDNHRGNILNASYTDVGIGVVQGPDGSLYITQDFIASPPEGAGASSDPPAFN